MIDMPQVLCATGVKRAPNYSHCPLKKRPIKYDLVDSYSSDSSNHSNQNGRISAARMDSDYSEPENLSTKPEDLKLVNPVPVKSSIIAPINHHNSQNLQVGNLVSVTKSSGPPSLIGQFSAKSSVHLNSHVQTSCASQYQLQYGQSQYNLHQQLPIPPPPPLKVFSTNVVGGSRPLEPISFNPQIPSWSNVSPYMPFNFLPPTNVSAQHFQNSQHGNMFPSYPKLSTYSPQPHHQIQQIHHQPQSSHFAPTQCDIGSSPPHISPPLNHEPSYPPQVKQEPQHQRHHLGSYSVQPVKQEFPKMHQHHSTTKESKKSPVQPNGNFRRESVISHHLHANPAVGTNNNRSRSLSSGSDRSSPIPDSSLSPCSTASATPTTVNGSIRYQCPDCSKSYSTFSGLSKHLQFHCASQSKKSFVCKFCDKVYTSLGALKMHIRTHTLPCKCTICGKAFSRPWLLQGHVRTHTGEKPFSCEFCHRAFADRSNLRAHLQTHSEVKKYSCQFCCKTFSRTSLLAKHKDSGCGNSSS